MKKIIILGLVGLFASANANTGLVKAQNTFRALAYAQDRLAKAERSLSTAQKEAGDVATATNELIQAQNACNALISAQSAAIMLAVQDSAEQKALDVLTNTQLAVANQPEDKQTKAMLNALVNAQLKIAQIKETEKNVPQVKQEGTKPYLWVYWETVNGAPMPGYISLCRKTLIKHCKDSFNIVQLDNHNIYDYLPGLREKEKKFKVKVDTLYISQKVDYYRLLLLQKYGGLYFDADMIVMNDLKSLVEPLDRYDYVGFGCYDHIGFGDCNEGKGNRGYGFPDNWAMVSRPNGILVSRVARNVENKLLNNTITDYFDLGRHAIWEEMRDLFAHNYRYFHCSSDLDGTRDSNGNWIDPRAMFSKEQFTYKDFNKILFFILFNSVIPDEFRKMSEEELLATNTNFAKNVKLSLGLSDNTEKEKEQKPYLWVYWENLNGATMPGLISLCRKSLIKHCKGSFNIVELDNYNIYHYLPELKEKEEKFDITKLGIAQKVDYYRVLLLHKYGGVYMDADMLVMRDLKEVADKLDEYDYVGFGCVGPNGEYGKGNNGYGKPENWAMASRANGVLISAVLKNIEEQLLNKQEFSYFDVGRSALWTELDQLIPNNYRYFHYLTDFDGSKDKDDEWIYMPKMFSDRKIEYKNFNDLLFIALFNCTIDEKYKKMTEEQLLNSKTNFAQYAKISLGL